MKTTIKYICTGLSLCACTCLVNNLPAQAETTNTAAVSATETGWDRQSIMEVARRVADWQIKDYPENKYAKSEPRGWIAGALYMGMFDWAELSGDNTYYDWLRKIFNRQSWQVANRMYHADDVCIAQTYIDFYNKEKNENMLKPTIARADWVLNNPSNGSMDLDYSKGSTIERWTWCDALFMAPGVYTRLYTLTGNRKYMHFADSEFRATYNHLYDKDEDLFYRDSRYIGQTWKDHTTPGYAANRPKQPVVRVSWDEANAFCQKISEISGNTVSLPTETQWEWAARSGLSLIHISEPTRRS